jgi:hypothetical protein
MTDEVKMVLKKVGGFTRDQLINTPIINGFKLINKRDEGFEIFDCRDLKIRLFDRVKGAGVVRTFGTEHFIVTEKKYKKLISKIENHLNRREAIQNGI